MKRLLLLSALFLMLTSCYSAKVAHGGIDIDTPTIQVNSKKNHFLFWGLVPLSKTQEASKYVGDAKNYVTGNQWTFVDGLLSAITYGIYSPTTTTYYIPLSEIKK